ncbi:MAG: hypothetical protein KGR24_05905 [Planctomycetes bacterium]|nr:hypothetical protein [Planctomycetota bacterium]
MTRVILGRNQAVTINGATVEGTRDIDVDVGGKTFDITSWQDGLSSTLVLSADVTMKVLIYWAENFSTFANRFNQHPQQPFNLGITGVGTWRVVATNVGIKSSVTGNVAWEVTCKLCLY